MSPEEIQHSIQGWNAFDARCRASMHGENAECVPRSKAEPTPPKTFSKSQDHDHSQLAFADFPE